MIVAALTGNWPTDENDQPMKFNKWRGFNSDPPPSQLTSADDLFNQIKQNQSPESKQNLHELFLDSAKSAIESGDNEKAVELATSAITLLPENDQAYQWRGFAHQELDNIDLAVDDYTTATRLNPQSGTAQVALCMLLLRVDFDQARIELAKAERMDLEPVSWFNGNWNFFAASLAS